MKHDIACWCGLQECRRRVTLQMTHQEAASIFWTDWGPRKLKSISNNGWTSSCLKEVGGAEGTFSPSPKKSAAALTCSSGQMETQVNCAWHRGLCVRLKNCRGRNSSEALEIMAHESSHAYACKSWLGAIGLQRYHVLSLENILHPPWLPPTKICSPWCRHQMHPSP